MRRISHFAIMLWFVGGAGFKVENALAQVYPTKPIRMIVPFPPTAGSDIVARLVGQVLAVRLGQSVVVDNRPGAGGTLGAELAAKATPDGYTLLTISTSHTVNVTLYSRLPYHMDKDFAPVARVASTAPMLSVNLSVPAASIKELIALAKSRPGQLNFASSGVGSSSHLAGELFLSMAGISLVHVPYKGSGPALSGLLAGEVQVAFFSIPSTLPHVKTGKLRALAVGSRARSQLLPDLPTIAESGVPNYDADTWYGVLAPARTPKGIIGRLNEEISSSLQTAEMRERLLRLGAEPFSSTPEKFADYIKSETAKYAKIVKDIGIRIE